MQTDVRHRYLFAIEDPLELDHNVARTVNHNGIVAIRDEFRRAWRIIAAIGCSQAPEGKLCALLEEPQQEQQQEQRQDKRQEEVTKPSETETNRKVSENETGKCPTMSIDDERVSANESLQKGDA